MVMAVMTTVVILVLAGLLWWSRSRNTRLGAIAIAAVALLWAIYRATALQDVHWLFIRHLGAGWIILFALLAVAVVVLVAFRFVALATAIAWGALLAAVLLPVTDIFTSEFWSGWANSPVGDKLIIIGLFILAIVFFRLFGWLVALILVGLAILMTVVWGFGALFGGPSSSSEPSASPPSASSTATPSASPSPATPSPSPSATVPSGALITTQSIVNWQQLKSAANADFEGVVNRSKPTQGNLGRAKTWDSPATDARLVVVFASEAQISDAQARQLVGASSTTLVTRASGCYIPYDQSKVCPSGNGRVVLTIAPTLRDSKGLGVVDDWGVGIIKTGGKYAYWPITYQ